MITQPTKIIIQNPKKYLETIKEFKEVSPFPNYKVKHSVSSSNGLYTEHINTCSALALNNGEQNFIAHCAPELKTSSFKNELDYKIKQFLDKNGDADGILVGGYDYQYPRNDALNSFNQGCDIAEILDKNKVPFSMIFGKINPTYKESIAVTPDAFILTGRDNISLNKPADFLTQETSKDKIQHFIDNYRVFELDDNHTLNFIV